MRMKKQYKTILTEQNRKKNRRDFNISFFKFSLRQLSNIDTYVSYIALMLLAFVTLGIPSILYNAFQDKIITIKGIDFNLGIILAVGYVLLEISAILIIHLHIRRKNRQMDMLIELDEMLKEDDRVKIEASDQD